MLIKVKVISDRHSITRAERENIENIVRVDVSSQRNHQLHDF